MIRSLARLHFPTRGRILVNGNDIAKASREYNAMFSFMPQRISIPGYLTAREVVTLFARLRNTPLSRVDEILETVALYDDADRLVREFSGGMVQRIGLAVTFVSEAEVYLLDEPTLNLDPLGVRRLRELITELQEKGKTFVFASHILEAALQLADRIGILV
ncbi:MAG: ABC transporter ATP-binding protein, partial [Chlorobi bacterium]|nr:ABC transporter ATP-binding protein [Chlorobiota bacterium]